MIAATLLVSFAAWTLRVISMRTCFFLLSLVLLTSCGSEESAPPAAPLPTIASTSDIRIASSEAGITPFIAIVHLEGVRVPAIRTASYVIEPKPGSVSRPVRVAFTMKSLKSRGKMVSTSELLLPVFGLYAGSSNPVSIELGFNDGSTQSLHSTITTATYSDPNGVYDSPRIIKGRATGSALGFDFFAVKSGMATPVIIDTDGAIRWVGLGNASSFSSIFTENAFVIGDAVSPLVHRMELDGTTDTWPLVTTSIKNFHHNIDPGRGNLLAEVDTLTDYESVIIEMSPTGEIVKEWNFATIIADHMRNGGDDPDLFVRRAFDWFHMNAATYDPRDDSLIVSSRENFVIKVDYDTGAIVWILGDPTKYWATFPSLRAKALTVTGQGLYPIGQHATSITADGLLLLFNDGFWSNNQPAGAPRGVNLNYSAVSAYRIDPATMTATEAWNFDYDKTIYSGACSSAYESSDQSVLVTYSRADNATRARLVGLDKQHQVVFDFEYGNTGCNTAWNAIPVPFENLSFE